MPSWPRLPSAAGASVFLLCSSWLVLGQPQLPWLGFPPDAPIAHAAKGNFAIYRENTGLDAINTTVTNIDWDTTVTEGSPFTLQGNNTDINLADAGHYLVLYSVPTQTSGGSNRSEMQSWLRINNTIDLAYGRGQGYIRRDNGTDEGYNHGGAIIEVSADDDVRVQMQRTDSNSATVQRRAAKSGISLLKLDDSWDYLRSRPSSNQTFGADTNFTTLTLGTDDELDTGSFSRNGGDITLKQVGHYLVTFNMGVTHTSGSIRINDEARLTLDGNEITGTRVTSYLRGSNGTNDGMLVYAGIISTTSENQVLNVQIRRESEVNASGHSTKAAETGVTIAKLPVTADYIRLGETLGGQNLSTTRSGITWDTTYEEDPVSFDLDATNTERINIESDADYLFFHSIYASRGAGNNTRETQFLEWRKNGSTLYQYGSSGQYNRGDQGSYDARTSGSSTGFIADGLVDTDYLELTQINEAVDTTSTYEAGRLGLQGVNLTQLFADIPYTELIRYRWRNDNTDLNSGGGWLAAEDSALNMVEKTDRLRLRLSIANIGTGIQAAATAYKLQFGDKTGLGSCAAISSWTGVGDSSSDAFALATSTHIDPDGETTTGALLSNVEGYTRENGEGLDASDTTGTIGPLDSGEYTELEFSINVTKAAITGNQYCFRIYDVTADQPLNLYANYPRLTIAGVDLETVGGEYGTVSLNSNGWTTVDLEDSYTDLVVVASARHAPNSDAQRAPRIKNKTATSFDIKVDNEAGSLSGTTIVDWLAMEAGAHSIDNGTGTTKVIAGSVTTSINNCNGNFENAGTSVSFSPNFNGVPAVLHTIASENDSDWVVSHVRGTSGARTDEPSASGMQVSLNRSFATCDQPAEAVDYIAFDQGHGTNNSAEFDAVVGGDNVGCCSSTGYSTTYSSSFASTPKVTLVAQLGENGGNGGYAVTHTGSVGSASTHYSSIDEDGPSADRNHTTEPVAVIAFGESSGTLVHQSLPAFDLDTYRWYRNANTQTPTTALNAEDTPLPRVARNARVRLRAALQIGHVQLEQSSQAFKLQYGEGGDCSSIGSWTDLGSPADTTAWRGVNNTEADGSTLTTSLLNSQSNALQTYEEDATTGTSPNAVSIGGRGEWDWAIQNYAAKTNTKYCFRIVLSDGTALYYTQYPQLKAGSFPSYTTF